MLAKRQVYLNFIRLALIILIILAILNDVLPFLYIGMTDHDFSGGVSTFIECIFYGVAAFLVCKNNFLGNYIALILGYVNISFLYQINSGLFSMALLKSSPQIIFNNGLILILIGIAILHLIMIWLIKE